MKPAGLRVARIIADKIAHQRSYVLPYMSGFIRRQPLVPKSDPIPEKCVAAKSEDGDSTTMKALGLTPSIENESLACMSNREKPTKPALR